MPSEKISPDEFRELMNSLLEEYGKKVIKAAEKAAVTVSKDAEMDLRHLDPKLIGGTGKYRRGWRTAVTVEPLRVHAVVYNKTDWQLTHLLEYGHQVRNKKGGRIIGKADPHEHIKPIKEAAMKMFEEEIRKEINNI